MAKHRGQQLDRLSALAVAAGQTVTRTAQDVSDFDVLRGTLAITGTGAGQVDLVWYDDAGAEVTVQTDVGASFEQKVIAPQAALRFVETGAVNPIAVDGILYGGLGIAFPNQLPGGVSL